jgi:accessory colonization factor AcfC
MTNEDWAQLAQQLTPEQKDKLIGILFGPEEDWSEVASESVLRLYGVDPQPNPTVARDMVRSIIHEKRGRGENIEPELLNLLDDLENRAADALRQGQ